MVGNRSQQARVELEGLEDRCLLSTTVLDLGSIPIPLGSFSETSDINDRGQVVGYAGHAFLWNPDTPNGATGTMVDLQTLDVSWSFANAVSSNGWVGGWYTIGTYDPHPFVWIPDAANGTTGAMWVLADGDPATGDRGEVEDINANAKAVGHFNGGADYGQAFLAEDIRVVTVNPGTPEERRELRSTFLDLNSLLPDNTVLAALGLDGVRLFQATGINDHDQIVANGVRDGVQVAVLLEDDDGTFANGGITVTPLGTLGGSTYVQDINDAGQAVGWSFPKTRRHGDHAFLWQNGTMQDLGTLGKHISSRAYAISNDGKVVGYSADSYGLFNYRAFLWEGTMSDLNKRMPAGTGWTLQRGYGVNAAGQIVGLGESPQTGDGNAYSRRGFFLTDPGNLPLITIGDTSVVEGDAGTRTATLTVTLSAPSILPVSLDYFTTDAGGALAGVDYDGVSYASPATLTFAPGETQRTLAFTIHGDLRAGAATDDQGNEYFFVNLIHPDNGVFQDGQGTVTIVEDEPAMVIDHQQYLEGDSGLTEFRIRVDLLTPAKADVSVHWHTEDNSAVAGIDYVAASGTLTIPAGQSQGFIVVQVIGDREYEPTEPFVIRLEKGTVVNAHIPDLPDRTGGFAYIYLENDDSRGGGGKGGKLQAASTGTETAVVTLTADQLALLQTAAIDRLAAAGFDVTGLSGVRIQVVDLPGTTLARAAGNTILVDTDAAGWGWFVDPTPGDDAEFLLAGDQGEQNHIDLLSVLAHELGHLLGYDHTADGWMAAVLGPGIRSSMP